MKKKNLKSLTLNKKSISNLASKTNGGNDTNVDEGSWLFWTCDTHPKICSVLTCMPSRCYCYTYGPRDIGPCPE